MQLTAQDKRAARDGFAYVVIRGGQRVCYTTTLGEAKRECGKGGKVVSISGMRYTAKNPGGKRQRARGIREDDATIGLRWGPRWLGGNVYNLRTTPGHDEYSELREYAEYARKAGDKKYHAKLLERMRGMREWDKEHGMHKLPNPSGFPVSSPSVKTLTTELGISVEDAKKIKELAAVGKPMSALRHADKAMGGVGGGSFGVESLYPDFPNFYYVNTGDSYNTTLYYNGKSLRVGDWGSYVESKSRNPRHHYGRR